MLSYSPSFLPSTVVPHSAFFLPQVEWRMTDDRGTVLLSSFQKDDKRTVPLSHTGMLLFTSGCIFSGQSPQHFMMAADLLHFIHQILFSHILLIALAFELGIDIPVIAVFPQVSHRGFIINAFILIASRFSGDLCHVVEFAVNTDNVRKNVKNILRGTAGFVQRHPGDVAHRDPMTGKLSVHSIDQFIVPVLRRILQDPVHGFRNSSISFHIRDRHF